MEWHPPHWKKYLGRIRACSKAAWLAPEIACLVPLILNPFLLECPSGNLFLVPRPAQHPKIGWVPNSQLRGPKPHGTTHRIHASAAVPTPPPGPTVIAELDLV